MTRIPPSITNVFKRITHSKRPADRNPTTMAAQPAPQQKTVRFAEDLPVRNPQDRQGHHAEKRMDDLAGGSAHDMQTTSRRDSSKADRYTPTKSIPKKEIQDSHSDSSSEESINFHQNDKNNTFSGPIILNNNSIVYTEVQDELEALLNNLSQDAIFYPDQPDFENAGLGKNSQIQNKDNPSISRSSDSFDAEVDNYINQLENLNYGTPSEKTSETSQASQSQGEKSEKLSEKEILENELNSFIKELEDGPQWRSFDSEIKNDKNSMKNPLSSRNWPSGEEFNNLVKEIESKILLEKKL